MSYISKGVDLSKYEKYEKKKEVELASERVELSLLGDIKKYSTGLKKYISEGQGIQKKGERLKSELNDIISALYKWEQLGDSMADDMAEYLVKFEKAAKELGVNPKESKDFVEGENAFKAYAEAAKGFNRVAENLRTIR